MSKVTLNDIQSVNAGSIINTINTNNAALRAALENTLSRDGTAPNEMNDILDMNSERIINLPEPVSDTEPVRKGDFDPFVDDLTNAVQAAVDAKDAAETALDDITDLYLGVLPSDPVLDNDGDPLQTGAFYLNSGDNSFRIYNGSTWIIVVPSVSNLTLNDLADVVISSLNTNDTIRFDGVSWVNYATSNFLVRSNHTGTQTAATISDFNSVTDARIASALVAAIGATIQGYNTTLASLAAFNSNGLLTQTAADTFTARTITGTSNKITVTNGNGVSGNPTLTIGSDVVDKTQASTYSAGQKQSFSPDATNAGVNLGAVSGDPSVLTNGDIWYNSSTGKFRGRESGVSIDIAGGGGGSAYSTVTDGTNTASATGSDTLKFRAGAGLKTTVGSNDVTHGDNVLVEFDAAALTTAPLREKLLANRTYYVRTDGSDSNSGLVNNSAGAFLTIQKAIDVICTLDLGGFAVTIQVDAGTYTNDILLARPFIGGEVTLQGDLTTPSNVVISHNAFAAFAIRGIGTALKIGGFRVQNSAGSALGQGIYISSGAILTIVGAMEMHTCTRSHFEVVSGSLLAIGSNYSFTGNAPIHWQLNAGDVVLSGYTITSSGSRAFSSAFLAMTNRAGALIYNLTKSGSATGPRYTVTLNSVCNVFGAGTSALFGNAAHGTPTATGGQYV